MIKDIKKALRKSAVYSFGNMSTKLLGLVLIPLYTNQEYLKVSDYGALGVLEITAQVLVALMSLTLSQSLTRWFWDQAYVAKQKSIFFSSLVMLIFVSGIMLTALIPFSDSFSNLLFNSTSYRYIITLLLINSALQILITQIQTLLKLQSKALWYSIVSILKLSITLVFTLYFIIKQGKKLDGIFEAQLIGSSVALLALIPYAIRHSRARFEKKILLEMLNYSFPLMLASISGVFFSVIDRYSLNYMDGLEKVGVYNLGYKIASTLKVVVITSVQLTLSPILMKKINDPNNKIFYSRVMTYFGFGLMFCVVGLSLFSLEVIKVASSDLIYWESANIVAILAFSFYFSMLKDSSFIGLQVVKKTRIAGGLIAISSVINLGLNLLLIPRFSIYGAAAGTLLSQVIFFVMILTFSQKWYRIPYEISRVMVITGVGVVLVTAGFFLNDVPIVVRLLLKTALLISYPFIFMIVRFYNKTEKENIRSVISSWKNPSQLIRNLKRVLLNK
jgi:O-antigen/teichoic acid export membrane protein